MNPHGVAIFVYFVAAALSFPVAWVVLRLYRRAVGRITRERAGPGDSTSPVAPGAGSPPRALPPSLVRFVDLSSAPIGAPHPFAKATAGPWVQAGIYALGGLAYAATTTWLVTRADGGSYALLGYVVLAAFHAWPIVIATGIAVAASARARVVATAGYALLLVALWYVPGLLGHEVQPLLSLVVAWSVPMLVPTVLVLAFIGSSLRTAGPMVLALATLAVFGSQVGLAVLAQPRVMAAASEVPAATNAPLVVAAFALAGLAAFAVVGWGALAGIRRLYARKRMSDETVPLDSVWLVFAIYAALGYAWRSLGWAAASLLPFVAYKLVTGAAMSLRGPRRGGGRPLTRSASSASSAAARAARACSAS